VPVKHCFRNNSIFTYALKKAKLAFYFSFKGIVMKDKLVIQVVGSREDIVEELHHIANQIEEGFNEGCDSGDAQSYSWGIE
jgi:hypothetical protein